MKAQKVSISLHVTKQNVRDLPLVTSTVKWSGRNDDWCRMKYDWFTVCVYRSNDACRTGSEWLQPCCCCCCCCCWIGLTRSQPTFIRSRAALHRLCDMSSQACNSLGHLPVNMSRYLIHWQSSPLPVDSDSVERPNVVCTPTVNRSFEILFVDALCCVDSWHKTTVSVTMFHDVYNDDAVRICFQRSYT